jgi:hypothetical protein
MGWRVIVADDDVCTTVHRFQEAIVLRATRPAHERRAWRVMQHAWALGLDPVHPPAPTLARALTRPRVQAHAHALALALTQQQASALAQAAASTLTQQQQQVIAQQQAAMRLQRLWRCRAMTATAAATATATAAAAAAAAAAATAAAAAAAATGDDACIATHAIQQPMLRRQRRPACSCSCAYLEGS